MSAAAQRLEYADTSRERPVLTGHERKFSANEFIVSKTDAKGIITYVNQVFLRVSGYSEEEMLGKPHNVIRHPDMPRTVFRLLWDTIRDGREIFAYVVNRCKNGDHYWVLAHVTPTYGPGGEIVGFHSSRRVPSASALEAVRPLYKQLIAEEEKVGGRAGVEAGLNLLKRLLESKGMGYDQFILSI